MFTILKAISVSKEEWYKKRMLLSQKKESVKKQIFEWMKSKMSKRDNREGSQRVVYCGSTWYMTNNKNHLQHISETHIDIQIGLKLS